MSYERNRTIGKKKTALGRGNIVNKSTDMGRYREYIRKRHLVENTKEKKASCCGKKTGMLNHRDKFELVPSLLNTWLMEAVKFRTEYETQFVNNKVGKMYKGETKALI